MAQADRNRHERELARAQQLQAQQAALYRQQQQKARPTYTAGDHMAMQQRGMQNFRDSVREDHQRSDRLFAENMAAVAGVMAATYAYNQHRAHQQALAQQALDNATPEQLAGIAVLAAQKERHWYNRRPTARWVMPDGSIVKVHL